MSERRPLPPKYVIFGSIVPIMVFLDLWTKDLIVRDFRPGQSRVIIDELFSITYARNYGAAFSLFRDLPDGARGWFFAVVTIVAVSAIFWFLITIPARDYWMASGLGLIFSGAVGNAVDRARFGFVVDFLDFYWGKGGPAWPTFNVADIGITVGAVIIIVFELLRKEDTSHASNPV
ncbi:MAG: signal peptidase II [Deltaproteobacteria bacterium]|nr:signal peptidase II [Deltaproteobacteria bacterium]